MLTEVRTLGLREYYAERRGQHVLRLVLPFGIAVLVLFGIGLDANRPVLLAAAPGILWMTVLLITVLLVERGFAAESEMDGWQMLRMMGLNPVSVLLAKTLATTAQLLLLVGVLTLGVTLFYGPPPLAIGIFAVTALLAIWGLAVLGILYGALVLATRSSSFVVLVAYVPVATPVLVAATRATEIAWGISSQPIALWWLLLASFALLYTAAGALLFRSLMEDG